MGELRRAFDQGFARPPAAAAGRLEDFLAVTIAGDAYAIRVPGLAGLVTDRRVVPVPSPVPELLGIAGLRGTLLPVYDLRALLGHTPAGEPPRWILLAGKSGGAALVGLAVDRFDRHLRVAAEDLAPPAPGTARAHLQGSIRLQDARIPIVELAAVIEDIERRTRASDPSKERTR